VVLRRVTEQYEPVATQVGAARSFVKKTVEGCGRNGEDAALVVSELASNAVRHGRSPFTVTVTCSDDCTLIEVGDENPRLPEFATGGKASLSGNGLHIVAGLAVRWGVKADPEDGKTVWAELS
jgi:anti-sigma regulatory factor (Ser/Thr protein kinase)